MEPDESEINNVYRLDAKKYYETRSSKGTIHSTFIANPAIREVLNDIAGKKLLDVGCGFGEDLKYFSMKGANVLGIELNEELVKIAQQDPELKGITILQGSIYSMNFKDEFDVCLANLVLDQVQDLKKAMLEVNKVLKAGGKFVFSVSHPLNCATDNFSHSIEDYFTQRKGSFTPRAMSHSIPFYFRNFEEYSRNIFESGFIIRRIIEPRPICSAKEVFPEKYVKYSKLPDILIMELIKV